MAPASGYYVPLPLLVAGAVVVLCHPARARCLPPGRLVPALLAAALGCVKHAWPAEMDRLMPWLWAGALALLVAGVLVNLVCAARRLHTITVSHDEPRA